MNKQASAIWVVLGAGVAATLLLWGGSEPRQQPVQVGDELPALVFERLEGGKLSLADLRGRTVVLNLWATWCLPCREEMPALERLSRALNPARYAVIGLSVDRDRNLVREFALRYGVTFPLGIAEEGIIQKMLGVRVLPDTLIVAPDGRLADRIQGSGDWASDAMRRRVLAVEQKLGSRVNRRALAVGGTR